MEQYLASPPSMRLTRAIGEISPLSVATSQTKSHHHQSHHVLLTTTGVMAAASGRARSTSPPEKQRQQAAFTGQLEPWRPTSLQPSPSSDASSNMTQKLALTERLVRQYRSSGSKSKPSNEPHGASGGGSYNNNNNRRRSLSPSAAAASSPTSMTMSKGSTSLNSHLHVKYVSMSLDSKYTLRMSFFKIITLRRKRRGLYIGVFFRKWLSQIALFSHKAKEHSLATRLKDCESIVSGLKAQIETLSAELSDTSKMKKASCVSQGALLLAQKMRRSSLRGSFNKWIALFDDDWPVKEGIFTLGSPVALSPSSQFSMAHFAAAASSRSELDSPQLHPKPYRFWYHRREVYREKLEILFSANAKIEHRKMQIRRVRFFYIWKEAAVRLRYIQEIIPLRDLILSQEALLEAVERDVDRVLLTKQSASFAALHHAGGSGGTASSSSSSSSFSSFSSPSSSSSASTKRNKKYGSTMSLEESILAERRLGPSSYSKATSTPPLPSPPTPAPPLLSSSSSHRAVTFSDNSNSCTFAPSSTPSSSSNSAYTYSVREEIEEDEEDEEYAVGGGIHGSQKATWL